MRAASITLAVLGLAAAAAQARIQPAENPSDPVELLDAALSGDTDPYEGRVTITHWFGKHSRAEEVKVFSGDEGRYRWEFLAPDGTVERILVCDGRKEELRLPRQHKVLRGDATKGAWKQMSQDAAAELLFKNYRAVLLGSEYVVGRPASVVELVPLMEGKPHQQLWIDPETHVILENKRFVPKKALATVSRFTRFQVKEDFPEEMFRIGTASGTVIDEHSLEPDFLSIADLDRAAKSPSGLPQVLPGGFRFESADLFPVRGKPIRHLRYTDGLVILSLFQTDQPVRLTPGTELSPSPAAPGSLRVSSSGKMLHWKAGRRYYTLIGDVAGEILARIAAHIKSRPN